MKQTAEERKENKSFNEMVTRYKHALVDDSHMNDSGIHADDWGEGPESADELHTSAASYDEPKSVSGILSR